MGKEHPTAVELARQHVIEVEAEAFINQVADWAFDKSVRKGKEVCKELIRLHVRKDNPHEE